MHIIEPIIRDYPWGSRTALAALAGRAEPASQPQAELWVGAHEAGPARVPALETTLDEHIAAHPERELGEVAASFGGRLPFLLKILAAEKALSIQAHPDAHRARAAPEGVYGDSWPKPEAWVPLEECEAFIGSLTFETTARRLKSLGVPQLEALAAQAASDADPAHALLSGILRLPAHEHADVVAEVVAAITAHLDAEADPAVEEAWRCILRVHEQFPGDVGVIVLLTMNHHVLRPGTSCFLAAGVLHTFVRGTAVEVLANSDNVVRAGLTGKPIDVEELLAIVDLSADIAPETPTVRGGVATYPSRADHFALHEINLGGESVELPQTGTPRVALAIGGRLEVTCGTDTAAIEPLQALWFSASDPVARATGMNGARLFVASPGTTSHA